jgi:hypothetical protein
MIPHIFIKRRPPGLSNNSLSLVLLRRSGYEGWKGEEFLVVGEPLSLRGYRENSELGAHFLTEITPYTSRGVLHIRGMVSLLVELLGHF